MIAEHCNLWRNYGDIQDSYVSVLDIIDFYGSDNGSFAQHAGPGNWNDPDMVTFKKLDHLVLPDLLSLIFQLIIGNFGLSYDQSRQQMAIWCTLAAPLIMSNDLRHMKAEFRDILQNKNAIKINQDPLGHQGRRVYHNTVIT